MLSLLLALQSTVWPVSSTAEFLAAESAALSGDRIVMQPGNYPFAAPHAFAVDVGVTITTATATGRAKIFSEVLDPSVRCATAGETLRIERLDFLPLGVPGQVASGALRVDPGDGAVFLENCTAQPVAGSAAGLTVSGATPRGPLGRRPLQHR